MAWRIGVDIGGTFTDVAMMEEDSGRIGVAKVLTTPADFGQGVIAGIGRGKQENSIDPASGAILPHAAAVARNARLGCKGKKYDFIAAGGGRNAAAARTN